MFAILEHEQFIAKRRVAHAYETLATFANPGSLLGRNHWQSPPQ